MINVNNDYDNFFDDSKSHMYMRMSSIFSRKITDHYGRIYVYRCNEQFMNGDS